MGGGGAGVGGVGVGVLGYWGRGAGMGRSGGAVEYSRPRADQVTGNKTARGERTKVQRTANTDCSQPRMVLKHSLQTKQAAHLNEVTTSSERN